MNGYRGIIYWVQPAFVSKTELLLRSRDALVGLAKPMIEGNVELVGKAMKLH